MQIFYLYENANEEKLLAKVIIFDDNQTIVKWEGQVKSLVIHKSLHEFQEISVIPSRRYLKCVNIIF